MQKTNKQKQTSYKHLGVCLHEMFRERLYLVRCVNVLYAPNLLLDLSFLIETFCRNLENKHRGSFWKNLRFKKKKEPEVIQNFRRFTP